MAELLPAELFDRVERAAADRSALVATLRASGTTMVHADLWPVSIAVQCQPGRT